MKLLLKNTKCKKISLKIILLPCLLLYFCLLHLESQNIKAQTTQISENKSTTFNDDSKDKLKGKVSESEHLKRLARPNSNLHKSVKILPENSKQLFNESNLLNLSTSNNDPASKLDSALDANNFKMSFQKMQAKNDWQPLENIDINMEFIKSNCLPCIQNKTNRLTISSFGPGITWWSGWNNNIDESKTNIYSSFDSTNWQLNKSTLGASLVPKNYSYTLPQESFMQPLKPLPPFKPLDPLPPLAKWTPEPLYTPQYLDQDIPWDLWYNKISRALYKQWQHKTKKSGSAKLKITVTKNRQINAEIINLTNNSQEFKNGLLSAIKALNGSIELNFPPYSQRQSISFQAEFSLSDSTAEGASSISSFDIEKVKVKK